MSDLLNLDKSSGVLDLTKVAPSLTRLKGILDWEPHPIHGESLTEGFDLDIFLFAVNSTNKISGQQDVCFYNTPGKAILNGAVSIPVDNRTGAGDEDEFVLMDLSKVPADKVALDIYVFVYEADKRGHNFGMITNPKFKLIDEANNSIIQTYSLGQHVNGTAAHIGRVQRGANGWEFSPIGEAAAANPNDVFKAYM